MLFAPLFVPAPLEAAVSEQAWIQAMLDAEGALARAEALAGVIPAAAGAMIAEYCVAEHFDLPTIGSEASRVGNPAEPLARALRRLVPEEMARYVHYGATSQDILDTASMLVTKRALTLIESDLAHLGGTLASLANEHADTLMVGRTLLQHALPITFGLKVAGWLAGVTRARAAMRRLHDDCLAAELGGAVGTLAALGDAGLAVMAEFARSLDLAEPDLPWHTERTRLAEIAAVLGIATGVVDKIALDIVLLAQTEVAEVREGGDAGGGSSTMPQKRNPVGSVLGRACVRAAQADIEILMRTMGQEHERAAGAWHAEWQALSGALAFTGGAVAALDAVMVNLEVYPDRMRENLEATRGLVMAERVTLLLAEQMGRDEAHALMAAVSRRTHEGNRALRDILVATDEVRRYLSVDQIERVMDPGTYLGTTRACINRALVSHQGLEKPTSQAGTECGG